MLHKHRGNALWLANPLAHTWTIPRSPAAALGFLLASFLFLVLRTFSKQIPEAINQGGVLIVDTPGHRQVSPLHPITEGEELDRLIDGRGNLLPANKEIYLFAETSSPSFCSSTC